MRIIWSSCCRLKTLEERFWEKVNKNGPIARHGLTPCWLWTACRFCGTGYGAFQISNRLKYAHRVSYELSQGKIPVGLLVRHACDVRSCVRPGHLLLGTHKDNAADRDIRGRQAGPRRGDLCGTSKLSWKKIADIRRRCAAGELQKNVARLYNVSRANISMIVTNRTWVE